VGDSTPSYVNIRVLAATNVPLEERIKEGIFREDLYYRLNVISIPLPPLRERREDIPLMMSHFLRNKVHLCTGQPFRLTRQAMAALSAHDWPGNVRELENAVERACALSESNVLQLEDFPPALQGYANQVTSSTEIATQVYARSSETAKGQVGSAQTTAGTPLSSIPAGLAPPMGSLKSFLREQEIVHINRALGQTGGDKEKAAALLGISLATFYRKMAGDDSSGSSP